MSSNRKGANVVKKIKDLKHRTHRVGDEIVMLNIMGSMIENTKVTNHRVISMCDNNKWVRNFEFED